VFLDADSGLDIGKSADINRKLYKLIEEAGLFPDGDFSLEVSSPGVDTPLRLPRQFKKNIGRTLEITPITGDVFSGVLQASDDQSLTLSLKGTKKSPPWNARLPSMKSRLRLCKSCFKPTYIFHSNFTFSENNQPPWQA